MINIKKNLANIISLSRVVAATFLFGMKDITGSFLVIYIFCAFTDLIDGPVARKTNSCSILGAVLDTIGDVMTYLALAKILILQKLVPIWIIVWIACDGIIFLICAVISKVRFEKLYLPHTYLGKIFGGVVFVLPFAMQIMPKEIWMSVICIIASVHAFELLYIQSKNTVADNFVASALSIRR